MKIEKKHFGQINFVLLIFEIISTNNIPIFQINPYKDYKHLINISIIDGIYHFQTLKND
jgi:hypothetical protein